MYDTMVNVWKYTNVRIEDRIKELKLAKAALNSYKQELTIYIREILRPLAIIPLGSATLSTFDPTTDERNNLLVKLQKERNFGFSSFKLFL